VVVELMLVGSWIGFGAGWWPECRLGCAGSDAGWARFSTRLDQVRHVWQRAEAGEDLGEQVVAG